MAGIGLFVLKKRRPNYCLGVMKNLKESVLFCFVFLGRVDIKMGLF